ncbi:Protein FAM173B [Collichthys lucidus]|uniref:Protein FAM173B n=1 Tax=Collichthys lucidus TaxID=240159 RepID=A0A4U5UTM3_COLLU|nr:Protein FAM173B [Collichthys lucidus]TKS78527.1 Protein FAM173B [Collichthys lucidus]
MVFMLANLLEKGNFILTASVYFHLRRFQVPYLPSSKDQTLNIMKLLEGRTGRLADLGSGDGRVTNLSTYNNVTAFLAPGVMEVLGEKLLKELPDDARVIACRFPFPNWPQQSSVGSGLDQTFAYDISSVRSHLRKVPNTVS